MNTSAIAKTVKCLALVALIAAGFQRPVKADDEGYIGDRKFSFGPWATFYDPKDGDGDWSGGVQLRAFLAKALKEFNDDGGQVTMAVNYHF